MDPRERPKIDRGLIYEVQLLINLATNDLEPCHDGLSHDTEELEDLDLNL